MIKTLSIPEELENFLKDNPDLSPSKILQSKIIEIKENRKLNFEEINKLKRHINKLEKHIVFLNEKLEEANEKGKC